MITQIRVLTNVNSNGKKFDQIRIWVAGLPFSFSCDADEYTLRLMRRLSQEHSIDFIDARSANAEAT